MRHRKHRHQLGVKKEHREAMMANLAVALIRHARIETTLAKAKALRPYIERLITLAKRAAQSEDAAKKLHLRRQAVARIRDKAAVKQLFDERVEQFLKREGGYARIYKLVRRSGDAAEMAIIELIAADDEGYTKGKSKAAKKPAGKKKAAAKAAAVAETTEAQAADAQAAPVAEAPVAEAAAEKPAGKAKKVAKKKAAEPEAGEVAE